MQAKKGHRLRPKALKQDDSIMGTNNSSIVSKRSVERLYYPNEPQYFRHFVKKPQRRAPLINRGYWLRMKAIDHAVGQFLHLATSKTKIVMNLGAGYDPLPWQCLTRYPESCHGVKFIDVDYKDLMIRKRAVVMAAPELNSVLTNSVVSESEVLFKSDQYLQIGCDLRDTLKLAQIIASVIDLENCLLLFTAEVSVTYMTLKGADALLTWAGSIPNARFCLLEQLLPQGQEHPFAKTMMRHFDKLQTPLQSVQTYPTTQHQEDRFKAAGWAQVRARNLWELWSAPEFLSAAERSALDAVEPFDEWEEFALFGSHYSLVIASNGECIDEAPSSSSELRTCHEIPSDGLHHFQDTLKVQLSKEHCAFTEYPKSLHPRRFAAPLSLRALSTGHSFGNFGGLGQNRLKSIEIYGAGTAKMSRSGTTLSDVRPSARMCHSITELSGDVGSLLVGGRNSPSEALKDCWVYHKWVDMWERVDDLPVPLYRHSAIALIDGGVMIMGGKSSSTAVSCDVFIWRRRNGWTTLTAEGEVPSVFGASVMVDTRSTGSGDTYSGLLLGGISKDGVVQRKAWRWDVTALASIMFKHIDTTSWLGSWARFGASVACSNTISYIIGGVTAGELVPEHEEILCCFDGADDNSSFHPVESAFSPRPLLVGTTVVTTDGELVIASGGAVCFSFGTFWNPGVYSVSVKGVGDAHPNEQHNLWSYIETVSPESNSGSNHFKKSDIGNNTICYPSIQVGRIEGVTPNAFQSIVNDMRPMIFEKQDLGACMELWLDEYLKEKIGSKRQVVVHQASSAQMDFIAKNFSYSKMSFGDLMDSIAAGKFIYLRSLSEDSPSDQAASLRKDFAEIAEDFHLPPTMQLVLDNEHSSPLRISGRVHMWLHYDVMANVLCQIRGSKSLLLFPPEDVIHLGFAPGASSSSIDVFELHERGLLGSVHAHEVTLRPGDILYIPPLWLHAARPTEGISISVNVFFRNLKKGYAAGRDVYGNRDVQAYEKGRQDVQKIIKAFGDMPEVMASFYITRLASEMRTAADIHNGFSA